MRPEDWRSELGTLADPAHYTEPLDLSGYSTEILLRYLRTMITIRLAEERIADLVVAGDARTPCHLGIGQEAVATGVCAHLGMEDRVFGGHRSHSQFLAIGGSVFSLIAEVLGKVEGASKGMGGSMHLFGGGSGFHGSVPIVGATIPIAVGAAMAARMDGKRSVAVVFFGDGACEEGVFHESLNLAAVYHLPIIFVCENNLFSSHLDIHLRQPTDRIARFAEAHHVTNVTVDGNDVLRVNEAARSLVEQARNQGGPGLLEAVTYRFRGHVGPNSDIDVGVRRRLDELEAWKRRCPIRRLRAAMEHAGMITGKGLREIESDIAAEIDAAVERARRAPYPSTAALLGLVYADNGRT